MKKSPENKFYTLIVTLVLGMMALVSCQTPAKKQGAKDIQKQGDLEIKQSPDDLLGGSSKAICYSGFRTGQHPDRGDGANYPTDTQIVEDLEILSKDSLFSLIRLYDSGENSASVLRLIKDNNIPVKVMLGIWLKAELSNHEGCAWLTEPIPEKELRHNTLDNHMEIQRGIKLANQYPDIVAAVNVGNEALVDWNDHLVHTDTIIGYCKWVKKEIQQPVTVADNYEWWAAHGQELAKVLDFISIHVYPVWEGKDIDEAMPYTIQNVQKVRNALPESKIVISEAGWASVAVEFGERASEEKQMKYFTDLMAWAKKINMTTFFFEAFDEDWKGDPNNPMGAEKHWGIFNIDRTPKLVMKN